MSLPDDLATLFRMVDGLNRKFPAGDDPFQIVTRLCEAAGELAREVNHIEGSGIKVEKYGAPDPTRLANEVRDVLGAALSLARHYGIEAELQEAIATRVARLQADGYLEPDEERRTESAISGQDHARESGAIRATTPDDVPQMVRLAAQRRGQYARYQPIFWREAADASAKHAPYLARLIARNDVIALVSEDGAATNGFIIATLAAPPPVYYPGGLVCTIDDFMVADPTLWPTTGRALLTAVATQARARGAALTVVVCGHRDEPKRAMLAGQQYAIASEWWIRGL
jgi:NTP pyrophosphatase (non-canonical NTP hydrolase)